MYNNNNFQYDANEFLLNLLELLNEELSIGANKKVQRMSNLDIADELTRKAEGESDVQASKRFWNFLKNSSNSIITDLFYGQFKSNITCLVCENQAVYFEPFSSLMLEIPELHRIDFLFISHLKIKPVIKLSCFIPVNALFQDIAKLTIEKYARENTSNIAGDFASDKKMKYKCLLVNTTTYTSRFVKLNDNIYQTSKRGNIIIFEIDENEAEGNYYPYICMIKEAPLEPKPQEMNTSENENEELKDLNSENNFNIVNEANTPQQNQQQGLTPGNESSAIQKENVQKKDKGRNKEKDQKNCDLNRKNVVKEKEKERIQLQTQIHNNPKAQQQEPEDLTNKNLSFPRLFNIGLDKTVRDLRVGLFCFMQNYYKFNFSELKAKYPEIIKKDFTPLNKINITNDLSADVNLIKSLTQEEYEAIVEEEYKYIFEENFAEISQTEYIKNFPFCVKLVSAKDDLKYKVLFCNNPDEYNSQFEPELELYKLNQYIKLGYKLVIELSRKNALFNDIKSDLNKIIAIQPKDDHLHNKPLTLDDCLDNFCLAEKLEKGNEWYCSSCKKNQNSLKKIELYYIPKNLIITLKRFETKMLGKTKIQIWKNNSLVKYPVNNLTLAKYFPSNNFYKENNIKYDLYAISQHSGSLEGGHYATACRNFGKWYELDDQTVFPSDEETVVSAEAYILFYRRKENIAKIKL